MLNEMYRAFLSVQYPFQKVNAAVLRRIHRAFPGELTSKAVELNSAMEEIWAATRVADEPLTFMKVYGIPLIMEKTEQLLK